MAADPREAADAEVGNAAAEVRSVLVEIKMETAVAAAAAALSAASAERMMTETATAAAAMAVVAALAEKVNNQSATAVAAAARAADLTDMVENALAKVIPTERKPTPSAAPDRTPQKTWKQKTRVLYSARTPRTTPTPTPTPASPSTVRSTHGKTLERPSTDRITRAASKAPAVVHSSMKRRSTCVSGPKVRAPPSPEGNWKWKYEDELGKREGKDEEEERGNGSGKGKGNAPAAAPVEVARKEDAPPQARSFAEAFQAVSPPTFDQIEMFQQVFNSFI